MQTNLSELDFSLRGFYDYDESRHLEHGNLHDPLKTSLGTPLSPSRETYAQFRVWIHGGRPGPKEAS